MRTPVDSGTLPGDVDEPRFDRALGPVEGLSIVVGTVIGSGIFLTPATIARTAGEHGFGTILLVWIVCGLLSLGGALAYAELAAMFPRAGGQYVFLREAYGPLWGFLFGWMEFWVARAGSIATLAVAFATYARTFYDDYFPMLPTVGAGSGDGTPWDVRWSAFLVIFVLTVINYLGVRWGGAIQSLFTATKVGALITLIACSFGLPGGSAANWQPLWSGGWSGMLPTGVLMGAIGAAMIQSLWAYDGWANGAAVSEEIKNPQRNVPVALFLGTLICAAIYISATVAYHYVLPLTAAAQSSAVAADAAARLSGEYGRPDLGRGLISAAVMISTFGAVNGTLLTGPRIFYAMARDGHFFEEMGLLHPRFRTPFWSIRFVGLWAGLLVLVPWSEILNRLLGWRLEKPLFDQLLTFVVVTSWAFYALTVAGLLVLRRTRPDAERPYRTWGYPVVPALFVVTAIAFVSHSFVTQWVEAAAGIAIVALGVPAYRWWDRRRS
jgi:basic amino acid/polyamine antiporter, APA family